MGKINLLFIICLFGSQLSAQYIQYGNGTNPPADFAAHPDDLAGLTALYNALDGPNWDIPNHGKWKTTPLGQDGVTPFFYHIWYMVHFKANHRVGKIIFWGGEQLSGAIPPEISLLSELEHFEIAGNSISDITELRNLPQLKTLIIKNSNLAGEIPCIVEDLPSLVFLDLSMNQLTGQLPECVSGPTSSLHSLSIRENNLTGCIPDSYNRFCSDQNRVYYFDDNQFENTIANVCNNVVCDDCPDDYPILWDFYQSTGGPSWTNVNNAIVDANSIWGVIYWENLYHTLGLNNWQGIQSIVEIQPVIPDFDLVHFLTLFEDNIQDHLNAVVVNAWFEDCDPCGIIDGEPWKGITCNSLGDITHINLHSSNLIGSLPPSLAGLTSLQSLNLANNQLSGSIPSSYNSLTNLQIWNMEMNSLSGNFPMYISNFPLLQYLNFSENDLSGSLPPSLVNLTYLKEFRVNDNQISGSLSAGIDNCNQLIHFDASNNQLSGTMRPEFGSLSDLTHLYLDENQFVGEIPGEWGDLQSIVRLDVSQNQLTGLLLDDNLENLCPINTITNVHINEGNNIDELWSMMCHCVATDYPTFSMYPASIPGLADPDIPCCQIFTDDVISDGDGNIYTAYRIGNQIWLQENLMTKSCLDGTPLPNYRQSPANNDDRAYYGDSNCNIPLWTHVANLTSGYTPGDLVPYGLHYSHYLFFSQGSNSHYITGSYQPYTDGAICQVCPDGYRIASAADFNILKDFLGTKDIYDVSETCINPVGGGYIVNLPQVMTNNNNSYTGAFAANHPTDYIWSPVYGTISGTINPYVIPYDIHFSPQNGFQSGSGNLGHHIQPRDHYRTIRCIRE